jgi:rod shape-determining protein MreD
VTDWTMVARWSVVILTTAVLQIGIAPNFLVVGVVADLMLLIAISAGVAAGPERGAIVGFWAGLAYDLIRPGPLGISALAYSLIGFAVGSLLVSVLQVRKVLAAGIVVVATMVGELTAAVGGQLFGQPTLANPRLWTIVVVTGLINGALSFLVIPVARWAEGATAMAEGGGMLGTLDG